MEVEGLREAHCAPKSIKLVLIRANGTFFYSVAAAAVLEADLERAAERMLHLFAGDQALCAWVEAVWLPARRARARMLRDYVEQTWPEFDFAAALHEYAAEADGDHGVRPRRSNVAHEVLARCLSAAQAARFYGALSHWAEDERLREAAGGFAREEALALARFRSVYERLAQTGGMGWFASWFAARRLVRLARDVQLPFVFACLAAHWRPHAPIAEMSYRDFVRRMRGVVRQRAKAGFAERALFAAWARRPRLRVAARAGEAASAFKPALNAR